MTIGKRKIVRLEQCWLWNSFRLHLRTNLRSVLMKSAHKRQLGSIIYRDEVQNIILELTVRNGVIEIKFKLIGLSEYSYIYRFIATVSAINCKLFSWKLLCIKAWLLTINMRQPGKREMQSYNVSEKIFQAKISKNQCHCIRHSKASSKIPCTGLIIHVQNRSTSA